jgi:cell shape-determining protein MreC
MVFVVFVVFVVVMVLVLVVVLVMLVILSSTTAVLGTLLLSVLSEVCEVIVSFFDGFKSMQGATNNRANPSTRLRPLEERRVERATPRGVVAAEQTASTRARGAFLCVRW